MTTINTESSVNSGKTLVERLARETDLMVEGDWINGLIGLMRELIKAKNEPDLSKRDCQEIYSLGERVQARIIELAKEDVDRLCNEWQTMDNNGISPLYLKDERDNYKALSVEVFPPKLWQTFRGCARRIQESLDWGSEQRANYLILKAENSILMAEDLLTDNELTDSDLRAVDANLRNARAGFREMQEKTHIRTVGLPKLAKKRDISVEKLIADLEDREENARLRFEIIEGQAKKKRLEKFQVEQRQLNQEFVKRARDTQEEKLQHTVHAIELRNKIAGMAAREFLEIILTNGDVARANACLVGIRRCEGGIPPILQELYGELLRTK